MDDYIFSDLGRVSIGDIVCTWNRVFSDYIVPVNMTHEKLEAYFKVTGVDPALSYGVFSQTDLVGMLINSVDTIDGTIVAYDAMTGIAPEHRGKGLFSQLFEYTKVSLKNKGITRYYLEVICSNDRACSIYKKKGGEIIRELVFMTGRVSKDIVDTDLHNIGAAEIVVSPLSSFPEEDLCRYKPTFGNRISALHRNIDNYQVACIERGGRKTAAIFSGGGDVAQILYNGENDRLLLQSVFLYLSEKFDNIRILNIPMAESGLVSELLNIGFDNPVNQFEMCICF